MTNRYLTRLSSPALLALIAPGLLLAQRAQITGRVTDSTGAVIVETQVGARNVDTGLKWEVSTNEVGYYTIPLLPPGHYEMLVRKEGFRPISRSGLNLLMDQTVRVDFVMEVKVVTDSVVVSAEAQPLLATTTATISTVIDNKRILDLPLNDRDPLMLASLAPGVLAGLTASSMEGRSPPS